MCGVQNQKDFERGELKKENLNMKNMNCGDLIRLILVQLLL